MAALPRLRALDRQRHTAALLLCAFLLSCSKDDPGCRMQFGEEGARFLVCADGSRVSLDPLPPGNLPLGIARSEAHLFGRSDHESITVLMRRTDGGWSTSTPVNPDGTWELEVPSGIYDIEYSAPGYESESEKRLPVAPGVSRPAPVVLRSRILLQEEAPTRMVVTPDERGLLQFFGDPGALWLWTFGRDLAALSGHAALVGFTPATNRIIFLDNFDDSSGLGALTIHDPATGKRTHVADDVRTWRMSADESVIAAELKSSRLVIWKEGEGVAIVGDDVFAWELAPTGRTLLFRTRASGGGSLLIHWDVAAAGGSALSASSQPIRFSPDGESFIYSTEGGESVLWDGLRHRSVLLGVPSFASNPVFGPDGQWLVFPSLQDGVLLVDLATPVPVPLPGAPDFWLFSEAGDALFFGATDLGAATLKRRDLQSGATNEIIAGRGMSVPTLAGDAQEPWLIFSFVPEAGAGVTQLLGWTKPGGVATLGESIDGVPWSIAPDGRSVAYLQDGALETVELSTGARSSAAGAADFPPLWQGPEVVLFEQAEGTFAVHDRIRGSTTSLGEDVDWSSCRSAPDGSTSCLARQSPNGGGSELARWDRAADHTETVTDGILEVRTSLDGGRAALRSRALRNTDEALLILFDPDLGVLTPLDDHVRDWVVTPRWTAWIGEDGEDAHLYFTAFPAESI